MSRPQMIDKKFMAHLSELSLGDLDLQIKLGCSIQHLTTKWNAEICLIRNQTFTLDSNKILKSIFKEF